MPPRKPSPRAKRPPNNTTCDVYRAPNAPPAAPDVAAVACALVAAFRDGSEASEGDQDLRYTHVLTCDAAVDIRDDYPSDPTNHRVYVPDKAGTGFDVVFVELVQRGRPNAFKRVYLDRRAPTWPTSEL